MRGRAAERAWLTGLQQRSLAFQIFDARLLLANRFHIHELLIFFFIFLPLPLQRRIASGQLLLTILDRGLQLFPSFLLRRYLPMQAGETLTQRLLLRMLRQRCRSLFWRKRQRIWWKRVTLADIACTLLLPFKQLRFIAGLLSKQRTPACQFTAPQAEAFMLGEPPGQRLHGGAQFGGLLLSAVSNAAAQV